MKFVWCPLYRQTHSFVSLVLSLYINACSELMHSKHSSTFERLQKHCLQIKPRQIESKTHRRSTSLPFPSLYSSFTPLSFSAYETNSFQIHSHLLARKLFSFSKTIRYDSLERNGFNKSKCSREKIKSHRVITIKTYLLFLGEKRPLWLTLYFCPSVHFYSKLFRPFTIF